MTDQEVFDIVYSDIVDNNNTIHRAAKPEYILPLFRFCYPFFCAGVIKSDNFDTYFYIRCADIKLEAMEI